MLSRRYVCTGVLAVLLVLTGSRPADAAAVVVSKGGDLQAALNAAKAGDTILLEPGAVFTGNFVIPRSLTLRTNRELPSGRITPNWSGRLAILQSPNNSPALRTASGVSNVRILGIEIAPNGHPSGTAILIGDPLETDNSRQPREVVLDRVLVRGHPVNGQKRGLSLHGSKVTVVRSHVSDIKLKGQDTQAIWINNGWGPYTIVDNYLEASGENIMSGGDTPRIAQLVPSDILIERNTIAKPLSWKEEGWSVKNLLELKSARRVTIRGNRLEGSWVSAQVGYGILLTPKDQYGKAPWTTVEDVLVELNIVHEVAEVIRVLGDDHNYPVQRARRITIRRNLLMADRNVHGGSGRCLTVGRAPQQIEFSYNTCIANGTAAIYTYNGGDVQHIEGGVFRANLFFHNKYGFNADGATAGGIDALLLWYPGGVLEDNVIGGGSASRYPNNFVPSVSAFKALFVDYDGGDFRLTSSAALLYADSSGRPPGVDFPALTLASTGTVAAAEPLPDDPLPSDPQPTDPTPVPPPPAPEPPPSGLPAGWTSRDIGSTSPAGSATGSGQTFALSGAGADIWGTADAFHFAYRTLEGNGSITARVASLQAVHDWTKAGVMMRETLDSRSRHAMALVSARRGPAFQRRVSTGGTSTHTSTGSAGAPYWVRLVREGDRFTAFVSADGSSWTLAGSETIAMPKTIYVGLAVTSHSNGTAAAAAFDHVQVAAAAAAALPSGWSSRDIGSVTPDGSAALAGGGLAVTGAGADIWGTVDAFHFAYRKLTGDGSITARVATLEKVHDWSKAGVMMRETLQPNAKHAMTIVSARRGPAFQRRTSTGGSSLHTSAGESAAPYWVRLVRAGDLFTSFVSSDGVNWTVVGSQRIAMSSTIAVGLAVTSHDDGTPATATFDQIQVID